MAWDASKYAGYKVTKLKPNGPEEVQELEKWLYGKDQEKVTGRHRRPVSEVRTGHWREWSREKHN